MKYKAEIIVKIKDMVKDARGEVAANAIKNCGITQNATIRTGAFYEVTVEASDIYNARNLILEITQKLLANPIIEEHKILTLAEMKNA